MKIRAMFVAVLAFFALPVAAQHDKYHLEDQERRRDINQQAIPTREGHRKLVYFNIKPTAGFGATLSRAYGEAGDGEVHLSGGITFFSLGKAGHIGVLGIGSALNFSAFSLNSVELRDASRADSPHWGTAGYFNVVGTIIPVRVGPVAYQFSWNGHVKSLGVDRGRLHMITFDVLGLIRAYRDQ